jgi:hypothetical protein
LAEKTSCNLAVLVEIIFTKVIEVVFAKVIEVGKMLEEIKRLAVRLEINIKAPLALELRVSETFEGFAFQEAEIVLA